MTARAGDALSRVYLMRCRTSISSLRKQHFPALFFGRIRCRDLTLPPGDADGNRGPQADLFRPDLHGPMCQRNTENSVPAVYLRKPCRRPRRLYSAVL